MRFKHLDYIRQTYYEHFIDTIYYSFLSLQASIYFLIHGIYPDIFIKSGSTTIFNINGLINEKYRNK